MNVKRVYMDEHNAVLDFCRNTPQRKFNIEMGLEIKPNRVSTILTTLVARGLITATPTKISAKVFEYLTVPDAVYTVLPRIYHKDKADHASKGITRVGNVTTVSSGAYHTKGSTPKRSVWIGSSADI